MKISAVLILASAAIIAAVPTGPDAAEYLITRADNPVKNLPDKSCRCGGRDRDASTYSASDIKKAAEASLDKIIQKKQIGRHHYSVRSPLGMRR